MSNDYRQQVSSKRWQIKRTEILQRDNFTCQNKLCKTPDNPLQVHHLDYLGDLKAWDYPNDMLVSLCDVCHSNESWRPILERSLANTLKMKGFFLSDLLALSSKLDTDEIFTKSLLKILRRMQNGLD